MSDFVLPQPAELTEKEKDDAMGAYLMMFAAWGVGLPLPVLNVVAAIIYHFLNRKSSRFVAFHSLQSLLSQLPVSAANVSLLAWIIRNLVAEAGFSPAFFSYMFLAIALNGLYLILSIVGMIRAKKGRFFYFPTFGRIAFKKHFGPHAKGFDKPIPPNKPPSGL